MDYQLFLAGRSNAGITEAGQNAAITITQLSALVCMSEPNFEDLVAMRKLWYLRAGGLLTLDAVADQLYSSDN